MNVEVDVQGEVLRGMGILEEAYEVGMAAVLRGLGHKVLEAGSPVEACRVTVVKDHRPDGAIWRSPANVLKETCGGRVRQVVVDPFQDLEDPFLVGSYQEDPFQVGPFQEDPYQEDQVDLEGMDRLEGKVQGDHAGSHPVPVVRQVHQVRSLAKVAASGHC